MLPAGARAGRRRRAGAGGLGEPWVGAPGAGRMDERQRGCRITAGLIGSYQWFRVASPEEPRGWPMLQATALRSWLTRNIQPRLNGSPPVPRVGTHTRAPKNVCDSCARVTPPRRPASMAHRGTARNTRSKHVGQRTHCRRSNRWRLLLRQHRRSFLSITYFRERTELEAPPPVFRNF